MTESQGSVLDILIYVFGRYLLADDELVPERDELALALEREGFPLRRVEQALDWLAELALERDRALHSSGSTPDGALRLYTESELQRLPAQCRGYLITLEREGILSPQHRELVIERLLALDAPELDVSQLKWIVLMVLSSQPGEELACARMEDLVFDQPQRLH